MIALLLLGAAAVVEGHHSFAAEFAADKPFKFSGTVTKVDWTNPHVYFYVDVLDEKTGTPTNWTIEVGAPAQMIRRGWSQNSMKIGDKVTVEGSLHATPHTLATLILRWWLSTVSGY
jgi:hypothetical protein